MLTCDDGGDPNQATDCGRSLIEQGVVAQVNDSAIAAVDVLLDMFTQEGVPRLEGSPSPTSFGSDTTYTLGLGVSAPPR